MNEIVPITGWGIFAILLLGFALGFIGGLAILSLWKMKKEIDDPNPFSSFPKHIQEQIRHTQIMGEELLAFIEKQRAEREKKSKIPHEDDWI